MHRMYAPQKTQTACTYERPCSPVTWGNLERTFGFVNRVVDGLLKSGSAVFQYTHPGEIKRREVELDLQVSPEEIVSREVELGYESWTSFASSCSSTAVQQTLSL